MKILTKVLGLVGLVGLVGILNNAQAYDVNYDNSSWMLDTNKFECVKLTKDKFETVLIKIQTGIYPFIGGIEVNFNKDPNNFENIEYAQFFVIPFLNKGYVISALGTTHKSCQLAKNEIISGNVPKRFLPNSK